jgi:Zinc carboxypeptidase
MFFRSTAVLLLLVLSLVAPAAAQSAPSALPTPGEFAGFPIGSDGNLVRWEKIVSYFKLVADSSNRVLVEELGKSTNGNPFLLATISSPRNLARLAEIRANQWKIAHPGGLSDDEAQQLSQNSPAVVLMTCNIHATEIASSQMALELVHRMATENSAWMNTILDNVVLLLVPSFNPDGQVMVTDWNNRVRGTKQVWSGLPWLYHPYVGHDNNRDAFMMTQVESRYVNKLLFQEWFPQVYLDQHQQGNEGMRVFVPPFDDPINPNVDPVIWAEVGVFGLSMFGALHDAGFDGVGHSERYTAWWQGGFLRGAWFHNSVGLLTEVASAQLATPVYQETAKLGQPAALQRSRTDWFRERTANPTAPAPPPTDVTPRANYPRPWLGGKWTLRDIIDVELVISDTLLETAAHRRERLIKNQIHMGRRAIEEGKKGDPYAYVLPAAQRDPGATYRLLDTLRYAGIEIQRAAEPFRIGEKEYDAGAFVIPMAQPFRAYVKDLLEKQDHPDPGTAANGSIGDEPYDVTAWTLPLQMGVEAVRVDDAFQARLEILDSIPQPHGELAGGPAKAGFLISPEPNNSVIATNRLLKSGAEVLWLTDETDLGGQVFPPGSLWVKQPAGPDSELRGTIEELGLRAVALDESPPGRTLRLVPPRVALYEPWTASIDEGWTRWLLEQYEFAFTPIHDADVQSGRLRELWDVIILPGDRGDERLVRGNDWESTPPEFRGGLGDKGTEALRDFVSGGGTLIAMGDSTGFAVRAFALPVKNVLEGVSRARFSCPGSLLKILVDRHHPVAYGMPGEATAVFENNSAFEPTPGFSYTNLRVIARYPGADVLESGWMRGEELLRDRIAAAEITYRKGRVVLIGFRPQFRAQPHNTFKLLFNAILYGGAQP